MKVSILLDAPMIWGCLVQYFYSMNGRIQCAGSNHKFININHIDFNDLITHRAVNRYGRQRIVDSLSGVQHLLTQRFFDCKYTVVN